MNSISVNREQAEMLGESLAKLRHQLDELLRDEWLKDEWLKGEWLKGEWLKNDRKETTLGLTAFMPSFDRRKSFPENHLVAERKVIPFQEKASARRIRKDVDEFSQLSGMALEQMNKGYIEKDLLKRLNIKLRELELNYGHIAAVSVTIAAIISGLKDLIDLVKMLGE